MAEERQANTRAKGILLEAGTNEVEFLKFNVGTELYGANVSKVTQIVEKNAVEITRLPSCNKELLGTMSFRGGFVPVYDLRYMLEIPSDQVPSDKQLLIVLEFNSRSMGFVVDGVQNIERVSWDKFSPLEGHGITADKASIVGTVLVDNEVVLILDVEAMMARIDPSMSVESFGDQVEAKVNFDRAAIRLVYCEDSPTIQRFTAQVLTKAGYTNLVVHKTGAEGLRHIKASGKGGIDIILSDIEMPDLDGLSLCREVKSDPELQTIPFIFFSSLVNDQMKTKCASVKGDACFSKPEIHKVVEQLDEFARKHLAAH